MSDLFVSYFYSTATKSGFGRVAVTAGDSISSIDHISEIERQIVGTKETETGEPMQQVAVISWQRFESAKAK